METDSIIQKICLQADIVGRVQIWHAEISLLDSSDKMKFIREYRASMPYSLDRKVKIIKCYSYNFKITTSEDIEIFEAMLLIGMLNRLDESCHKCSNEQVPIIDE